MKSLSLESDGVQFALDRTEDGAVSLRIDGAEPLYLSSAAA